MFNLMKFKTSITQSLNKRYPYTNRCMEFQYISSGRPVKILSFPI